MTVSYHTEQYLGDYTNKNYFWQYTKNENMVVSQKQSPQLFLSDIIATPHCT